MSLNESSPVYGTDGLLGTVSTSQGTTASETVIRLTGGGDAVIPSDALKPRTEGGFFLPLGLRQLRHNGSKTELGAGQSVTLPVTREDLVVEKRLVEASRVVVHIEPRTRTETIDVPLTDERVEVERVPVNRVVASAEPIREDGDVTIIPVYEEVLVVERRLMLKEEVRITRRKVTRREKQDVTLRTEEVHITRSENKE